MVIKLAFLIVLLGCQQAAARQCHKAATRPTVFIREMYGETEYDYTKTSEQIQKINVQKQGTGEKHSTIKGLTVSDFRMQLQMDVEVIPVEDGTCVYPKKLSGYMGYEEVIIYVDKQYPLYSCQRYVIEEHENQHAMINNQVLYEYLPGIVHTMTEYVVNIQPVFIAAHKDKDKSEVNERINAAHKEISDRVFKRAEQELLPFYAERDRRNAIKDTDESYKQEATRCLSW